MTIFDQMCECCCDRTMSQDISDREIESLERQIADLKAEQARLCMEEIGRRQVQATENAADLYRYHAGLTEVINVEPINTEEEVYNDGQRMVDSFVVPVLEWRPHRRFTETATRDSK